jgi:hypothetical protein
VPAFDQPAGKRQDRVLPRVIPFSDMLFMVKRIFIGTNFYEAASRETDFSFEIPNLKPSGLKKSGSFHREG